MGCVIAGQKFIETQFNTTGQKQENFNFACSILKGQRFGATMWFPEDLEDSPFIMYFIYSDKFQKNEPETTRFCGGHPDTLLT